MELGNNIWLFPLSTQKFQKSLGGYQLILAPLTIVRDALLNANSFLCQKVLELSLGFKRLPIPFDFIYFLFRKML